MTKATVDGLWDALAGAEAGTVGRLGPVMSRYEPAVRACYEAGVEAAILPTSGTPPDQLRYAAVFLKRTLTDLRATWLLLRTGYTPAAAATAAALWENALATSCLSDGMELARALKESPTGDLPWRAQKLAKKWAGSQQECPQDYEALWLGTYGSYKWLCKIKHPTLRAGLHEIGSTSLKAGEFTVIGVPDPRDADLPMKVAILSVALMRTFDAVEAFAFARGPDEESEEFQAFDARMRSVMDSLGPLKDDVDSGELPFTIADDKDRAAKYMAARLKQERRRG